MHRFLPPRLLTLGALLFVAEHALSPFFFPDRGRIDFFHLLILDYAFSWSGEQVPFFALLIGLFRDFFGAHLFGIETVSLTITSLVLYLGTQKLDRGNFWIRTGMCFFFSLFAQTVSVGLGLGMEVSRTWSWGGVSGILATAVYTAAASPVFFWLTDRWFKRISALKQYELF